jgi:3-deoxy-D-manno-octulosonate 8-phosphate phosphatase (KDO 8-P phosphatase)
MRTKGARRTAGRGRPASAGRRVSPALARRIRMVGLDVDGIRAEFKRYDIQDGLGVFLLRQAGLKVSIVTGRVSDSVRLRAEELQVDDLFQDSQARKLPGLRAILDRRGVTLAETAFVGDDLPDLAIMRAVGLPVAVANAVPEIRDVAALTLERPGGSGAIREFAELLLRARGQWESVAERYVSTGANADLGLSAAPKEARP